VIEKIKAARQDGGFVIKSDTAGEFARGVRNRGFAFPAGSILPSLRPNGPRWEFASSIKSAGEPRIA
jgi:hypothetical protein